LGFLQALIYVNSHWSSIWGSVITHDKEFKIYFLVSHWWIIITDMLWTFKLLPEWDRIVFWNCKPLDNCCGYGPLFMVQSFAPGKACYKHYILNTWLLCRSNRFCLYWSLSFVLSNKLRNIVGICLCWIFHNYYWKICCNIHFVLSL